MAGIFCSAAAKIRFTGMDVPVKLHAAQDISFGVVWMAM